MSDLALLYDDLAETYAAGRHLFDTMPVDLPRAHHAALFAGFERARAPRGALLLALATREYTGQDEFDGEMGFLGRWLPYSHDRSEVALGRLEAVDLAVVGARRIETGGEAFFWVIARKPNPAEGAQ